MHQTEVAGTSARCLICRRRAGLRKDLGNEEGVLRSGGAGRGARFLAQVDLCVGQWASWHFLGRVLGERS